MGRGATHRGRRLEGFRASAARLCLSAVQCRSRVRRRGEGLRNGSSRPAPCSPDDAFCSQVGPRHRGTASTVETTMHRAHHGDRVTLGHRRRLRLWPFPRHRDLCTDGPIIRRRQRSSPSHDHVETQQQRAVAGDSSIWHCPDSSLHNSDVQRSTFPVAGSCTGKTWGKKGRYRSERARSPASPNDGSRVFTSAKSRRAFGSSPARS